ncbi:MAG: YceI family protein [Bacteroidota bacterium]
MVQSSISINTQTSTVSFSVKKFVFLTVKGQFSNLTGSVQFQEDDLANSTFDVQISSATVNTENEKRDEHLRNEDFFFVKQYPTISFKSTTITQAAVGYEVEGQLTMLDKSVHVRIPFQFDGASFKGDLTIQRSAFGLGKKFPGFFVGNDISVSINAQLKK